MARVNAEKHLVDHYAALGDLKSDFRNWNLFNLVAGMVKGRKILDIGCGPGNLLKILESMGKEVLGVEPSDSMRSLASKLHPNIRILPGTDSLGGSFDTALMIDVLEHIEDDAKQLREVAALLKNDGEFVVVVPAHPLLFGLRDKEMGHYRRYSARMLRNILENNGFSVRSLRHWNALGFLPYFLSEKIFKKALESKSRQKGNRALDWWFRHIENSFDFGFGLSIICVAHKHEVQRT